LDEAKHSPEYVNTVEFIEGIEIELKRKGKKSILSSKSNM